ncbi:NTP transferase domain-containing protein [Rhodococcus sp. BP-349]|uniref:NTP transferase domain-containing protein n=1 Tax=unclassified Rhodococcus (in: high G+C Gram-positive bacteria) TaxID=192944 RepID=UPI001C9B70F1|nr:MULTISPECIES: NTP transferase domain-containing protein [unclassified Rhodococcus (in: high G+C Gram-positive bacteria)]MBY6538969.1 NTP transferase domain-containing protein [Rhodococcus sp. BP-363]MBY6543306.1 NTP transferase domain-containing protein [Rhodococcus sp. BP-369]MBY6562536.1 NTP transferase domain-containing protein [Rhodococcus sp. BP-370]MBY6576828.1 NTP transferase domain-containing protein [Rhodococcus sp. BP-364]MBY6586129.1 NTP transferase domain-containing protein [Rho
MSGRTARTDALILAGGRSSRMQGTTKPTALVDGVTLVDRVVAATSFCTVTVVVGPDSATSGTTTPNPPWPRRVRRTREDPPFGGPVRALAAGLAITVDDGDRPQDDDVVLTLSADLPYITEPALRLLVRELLRDTTVEAVFGTDSTGRTQYLVGAWRRDALVRGVTAALARCPADAERGPSIRDALPDVVGTVALTGIDDVDTPTELAAVRTASRRPSVEVARVLVGSRLTAIAPRTASLAHSLGGTLAEPLVAARPFPSFVTSAMDGYAVRGDGPWHVDDTVVVAGATDDVVLDTGHAVRIATGAAVPAGASVVRDEFVVLDDDGLLHRSAGAPVRDDARRIAEDWDGGSELAPAGAVISPAVVSAALSAGVIRAATRPAPTVRLVLTGDEIGDDTAPVAGRIRDTIGPVMPTYLRSCGFSLVDVAHCADTDDAFDAAIHGSADSAPPDVVVIIGATGGGAADRLDDALRRAGAHRVVDGLACRPGGSASVSELPDHRVVLGVPGNPYAAVTTVMLLGPAISAALTGRSVPIPLTGTLATEVNAGDVTRALPASYVGSGTWRCENSVRTAHLAALVGRDGIAVITAGRSPGAPVEIVPLPQR